MKNCLALAILTTKEGFGYRILYSVLILALAVSFFAVLLSGFFMRDIAKVIVDFSLAAVSIASLLVPLFLTVKMVAGDFEQHTIFTLLAKPISRPVYITGKFLGLSLLSGLIISIVGFAGITSIWMGKAMYPAYFFASFSLKSYLIALFLQFIAILILNSLVIFYCCLTTSSFLVTLLAVATYITGHTIDDVVVFFQNSNTSVETSKALKAFIHIIQYIIPNLSAFDIKQLTAHGITIPFNDVTLLSIYGIAYIIGILGLATYIFNKRDLP